MSVPSRTRALVEANRPASSYNVPIDPATIGWSPTLPLELAMREKTPREICDAYGISREEWDRLRMDDGFRQAVKDADDALRKDGARFKLKAAIQAEELLKRSFQMIYDPAVPSAVQADLLKFTVKAAGLDASKEQAGAAMAQGMILNINLG